VVEFLVSCGLLAQKGDQFEAGEARIFLGNDSPLITKLHTNWRMRAIQSFDHGIIDSDLHYSTVVTLSEEDALKIRADLIKAIEVARERIRVSPPEEIHCFSMDFFKL